MILYIFIPTINGEINGDPFVTLSPYYNFGEFTIYEFNIDNFTIKEVDI